MQYECFPTNTSTIDIEGSGSSHTYISSIHRFSLRYFDFIPPVSVEYCDTRYLLLLVENSKQLIFILCWYAYHFVLQVTSISQSVNFTVRQMLHADSIMKHDTMKSSGTSVTLGTSLQRIIVALWPEDRCSSIAL